jgi:hypothetical protein
MIAVNDCDSDPKIGLAEALPVPPRTAAVIARIGRTFHPMLRIDKLLSKGSHINNERRPRDDTH